MSLPIFKHINKNIIALLISQYGGMFCNIFLSIKLTRLLTPENYGLVAKNLFFLILFNWISEWGWDAAFMSHKEIELNTAASTHLVLRFIFGILPLVVFSISGLFGICSVDAFNILICLSVIYLIEKVGLTYKTILERNYLLHKIAGLEFCASVLSYIFALSFAFLGLGVYSLIAQRFVEKTIITVGYFCLSPWKIGLNFKFEVAKTYFLNFGIATWLGGVFAITIYDFMPFLIATLTNVTQAGLYEKAFNLATFPMMLTGIASRMTIPLYTQFQNDSEMLKDVFIKAQSLKFVLLFPMQIVLCCLAPFWIPKVFGTKWTGLIIIYQIMTVYGLFRAFFDDVPPIFIYGFKNPWELTKSLIIQSIFIICFGFILVYRFGAIGGAISMSIMMLLATILFWRNVFFKVECSLYDFGIFLRNIHKFVIESLGIR